MSHQSDTLGRHVRHALKGDGKKLWDQTVTEYRRTTGATNTIGMIEALCAECLLEWSKREDA